MVLGCCIPWCVHHCENCEKVITCTYMHRPSLWDLQFSPSTLYNVHVYAIGLFVTWFENEIILKRIRKIDEFVDKYAENDWVHFFRIPLEITKLIACCKLEGPFSCSKGFQFFSMTIITFCYQFLILAQRIFFPWNAS